MVVKFKEINEELAYKLLNFVGKPNLGKSIVIDGETYTLDYISVNSNRYFKSRGFSVYFRHKKSIIRISDHWAKSNLHEKSRKLNCGFIDGHEWVIDNKKRSELKFRKYAGKYHWVLLAGKASLAVLNKDCDHWKKNKET